MKTLKKHQEQSRLGQILVQKNLISHAQLSQAIDHQATTGKRLGDILTEWDLINHQHVHRPHPRSHCIDNKTKYTLNT